MGRAFLNGLTGAATTRVGSVWPAAGPEARERKGASRRRLLDLSVAVVEDAQSPPTPDGSGPRGVSADFQVALPYRGLLVWHVGRDAVVGDANQVLFVAGGEPYRISDPVTTGCAELIVTPEPSVLAELAGVAHDAVAAHPLFRRRSRRADPRLQVFRTRVLSWANGAPVEDLLAAEELVIALLRSALDGDMPGSEPAASTRRLIRCAKEFLEAQLATRIRLADVARTVGASPAYLTHVFRRAEGAALHQYVTQLRLARALAELPHTDDLTTLALDIGFSSHSHFSAAFRRAFGMTPSQFRDTSRKRRPRSLR
jgi:AraC-like DNA-binding protein